MSQRRSLPIRAKRPASSLWRELESGISTTKGAVSANCRSVEETPSFEAAGPAVASDAESAAGNDDVTTVDSSSMWADVAPPGFRRREAATVEDPLHPGTTRWRGRAAPT